MSRERTCVSPSVVQGESLADVKAASCALVVREHCMPQNALTSKRLPRYGARLLACWKLSFDHSQALKDLSGQIVCFDVFKHGLLWDSERIEARMEHHGRHRLRILEG